MISNKNDFLTVVKSMDMTPQQKLVALGNISERIFSPVDLLGYTEEELGFLENQMICDLNEGYAVGCFTIQTPEIKKLSNATSKLTGGDTYLMVC